MVKFRDVEHRHRGRKKRIEIQEEVQRNDQYNFKRGYSDVQLNADKKKIGEKEMLKEAIKMILSKRYFNKEDIAR